ncbi:hypothetical protein BUALT_Bualt08G0112000 [Buddleja alternifolia]|uniref:Uncharacterized protein n=1 Tax=Buddleja alternifolia TaxID=168488 RepID=A0AAV6X724_9LAMI|nr:hypothetical protein BUALT_Bualt08G0112000 [Buddleja alternifolia]
MKELLELCCRRELWARSWWSVQLEQCCGLELWTRSWWSGLLERSVEEQVDNGLGLCVRPNHSSRGENNNYGSQSDKKGSVVPKDRKHVSTMVGEKIVEVGEKAVKSAVKAVKNHNKKGQVSPHD